MIKLRRVVIGLVAAGLVFGGSNAVNAQWGFSGCPPQGGFRSHSVGFGPSWNRHPRAAFYSPGVFVGPGSFRGVGVYGPAGFYSSRRVIVPGGVHPIYGPWGGPGWSTGFGPGFGPGFRSGVSLRIGF
jgi:hypothetical protein